MLGEQTSAERISKGRKIYMKVLNADEGYVIWGICTKPVQDLSLKQAWRRMRNKSRMFYKG